MEAFSRNGMQFTVSDRGPQDAETVVLLHGFPQSAQSWAGVSRPLLAAGYRVIATYQRGYTAQARPRRRRAYRLNELVADVVALVDAAGVDRVHLVGHDIAIGRRAAELTSRWVTGRSPSRCSTAFRTGSPNRRRTYWPRTSWNGSGACRPTPTPRPGDNRPRDSGWHELSSRSEAILQTLLVMTSYQPVAAPRTRLSPAKLAIAGVLTMVLSIAMVFGGSALFGSVLPPAVMLFSLLGRALFIAGIVLVVLAVVRLIESR